MQLLNWVNPAPSCLRSLPVPGLVWLKWLSPFCLQTSAFLGPAAGLHWTEGSLWQTEFPSGRHPGSTSNLVKNSWRGPISAVRLKKYKIIMNEFLHLNHSPEPHRQRRVEGLMWRLCHPSKPFLLSGRQGLFCMQWHPGVWQKEREKLNTHTYTYLNECKDTLGCFLRCFATSSGAHDRIQPGLHDATKSKQKEPNLDHAKKMWQKSIFTQMTITLKKLIYNDNDNILLTFSHLKNYINIPDNYFYTFID